MATLKLSWTRPAHLPYPMTWSTFQAKDIDSDELVDYDIRDLTMDRFDEAFHSLTTDYLQNEPMNMALHCADDPEIVARFRTRCLLSINQKTAIACFKADTNEIAGINMVMVLCKSDNIREQIKKFVKAENERITYDAPYSLYDDFDIYEHYQVNELLTCCGLSVLNKFIGRAIGLKLLQTRAQLAKAYGIKIAHSDFSSNYSIPQALKAGFKIDRERTYEQLYEENPRFNFLNIGHERLAIMTWVFAN